MRRIKRFLVSADLMIEWLRGGSNPLTSDLLDGVLCRITRSNLPPDARIVNVEWEWATQVLVVFCESETFPEVDWKTVSTMPPSTILMRSAIFPVIVKPVEAAHCYSQEVADEINALAERSAAR